ncbi:hypothetical protein [Anaerofustis stercorihominis]|uniref:hypothetical protein n=1 Tax=Anaerofustis stercorihominis TaxID=214853 RepID=UPI003996A95B
MNFDFSFDYKFNDDLFSKSEEDKKVVFDLNKSFNKLCNSNIILPKKNQSLRMISPAKGWSSCNLIMYIASNENIYNLIATTLRVGKKEITEIEKLFNNGNLKEAHFILSGISKENRVKGKTYDYQEYFENTCKKCGFTFKYINNHSKVILIKTFDNYYVIETSSNLNENPKIEQFVVTNSKEICEYYIKVFKELEIL